MSLPLNHWTRNIKPWQAGSFSFLAWYSPAYSKTLIPNRDIESPVKASVAHYLSYMEQFTTPICSAEWLFKKEEEFPVGNSTQGMVRRKIRLVFLEKRTLTEI